MQHSRDMKRTIRMVCHCAVNNKEYCKLPWTRLGFNMHQGLELRKGRLLGMAVCGIAMPRTCWAKKVDGLKWAAQMFQKGKSKDLKSTGMQVLHLLLGILQSLMMHLRQTPSPSQMLLTRSRPVQNSSSDFSSQQQVAGLFGGPLHRC